MSEQASAKQWAFDEFGTADLGDSRRRLRLLRMAAEAAIRPDGRVSEVFTQDAQRQGAYDFLESEYVEPTAVVRAVGNAAAKRCAEHKFVFVAVDGTSIAVTDWTREKDFGAVGTYAQGGRGLKVIDALAVSPTGIPLGLCALEWWKRPKRRSKKRSSCKAENKETKHWLTAIEDTCDRIAQFAPQTRCWFQLDREADGGATLAALASTGHWFTVRSSADRRLQSLGNSKHRRYLHATLRRAPVLGEYELDVPGTLKRTARRAHFVLRATTVTLEMRTSSSKRRALLPVNVVWAHEKGTVPPGEKPIDWKLFTNFPVRGLQDACLVLFGYSQRWRIEDFHRTWKSGTCNVEAAQLRSANALIKWATILASVAVRIERLKHLAREQPQLPASAELSSHELRALLVLKRREKKRTETIPDAVPTIAQATRWIADLGGYTGKSSGGPPGSITLRRGLERVLQAAQFLEALEIEEKK